MTRVFLTGEVQSSRPGAGAEHVGQSSSRETTAAAQVELDQVVVVGQRTARHTYTVIKTEI